MAQISNYEIKRYAELSSTQDEAKRLISSGQAKVGQVIVAEAQASGHGRYTKHWESNKGDVAVTIIVKPEVDLEILGQICYAAALAVAETITALDPNIYLKFKWVNDILVNDRKVCGILLEKVEYGLVLVGIGINVKSAENLKKYNATSLESEGISVNYDEFVKAVIESFVDNYNLWLDQGFSPLKVQWLRLAKGIDEKLQVNLFDKSIEGIFLGIDDAGNLLLMVDSKVQSIPAGQIFFKE